MVTVVSTHSQLAGEEQPHWVVRREEVEMTTEELGRGGWGVVNVAKFRGLRVAAKCLHQVIISRYNIRRFTREMSIAAKLQHPNLLLFIELSREQVISIGRDVSCGLSYMHQWRPHPIIHRDISSSNILLEPLSNGWRAKISDYGSANFMNLTTTRNPGSMVYAAPEAWSPEQHSPKMDVFSLGVLLVETCLGEFPESTAANRVAQIRRIDWPAMVSLIEGCTRVNPVDRPNASDIMSLLDRM